MLARDSIQPPDRFALLAGRPLRAADDDGPLVCSCFAVGRNALCKLIESEGLTDVRQVGARLRAGSNCGSCLPEIRALLTRYGCH
jgi:assimilatory nitrate reductase catalytic subunit